MSSNLEAFTQPHRLDNTPYLPGCTIALKCADDPSIANCLDSIDDNVSVHVVITPSDRIQRLLEERGVEYSMTEYGNIARSAQLSIERSPEDTVIVMDSDTRFTPGSIRRLREALVSNIVAKPAIEFETDGYVSSVIARARHSFNNRPDFATCPGLAFRKRELTEACGQIFNPLIRWTEDADLNFRMHQAGVGMAFVPEAKILHGPVDLGHELRSAFYYGIGKRLSVEHTPGRATPEEFPDCIINALHSPRRIRENLQSVGVAGFVLDAVWQGIYLTGYHRQKHTGAWSITE
jgi:hypothetical protein